MGATEDDFKNVVKNCVTKGPSGNNYKIPCGNMLTSQANPVKDFSMGWRTHCNDDNEYNPATGTCNKDCDGGGIWEFVGRGAAALATMGASELVIAAEGSLSESGCGGGGDESYGNPGGPPAFGYWEGNKMWAVPKNIQGVHDFGITKTSDDDDTGSCPTTHTKEFICAGDGVGGIGLFGGTGAVPGCASGKDISGVEGAIRFCAREDSSYNVESLMNCCLTEKGDDDQRSHSVCPVGYCRTQVNYTDALENYRCKEATGSTTYDQHCYEMTSECNNLFKDNCTAELFNDTNSNNNDKRTACRKWARIQPAEFETFASSICSIQKNIMGSNYTGQETNEQLITALKTDSDATTRLVKIFKSDLCRDWLIGNGQMKLLLSDICSVGVVKDNDGNIKVTRDNVPKGHTISNELSDICHCYWTEEYYTWYKENVLSETERNSIGQNKRPECFHSKCMLSGMYTAEDNTECPSIINCRNEVNTNILSVGNKELKIDEDAIARLSSSQSCNIETVNQQNTTPTPTTDTSGSSPTGGSTLTDSSTGGGEQSGQATTDGETRSYDGSGGRNTGTESGTSSKEPEDNNTVWIIIGVSVAILLIMIIVIASGGKSQMPGMPGMPGMYNPYMR